MREFQIAVRYMKNPVITEDEIANSAGLGDTHNGVNFMRAACIIAMQKAQVSFDPVLEALKNRGIFMRIIVSHLTLPIFFSGSYHDEIMFYCRAHDQQIRLFNAN